MICITVLFRLYEVLLRQKMEHVYEAKIWNAFKLNFT